MGEKPNILAGSMSQGLDAPRAAGSFPNSGKLWENLGWLEVSRTHLDSLGDFGKLPATLGASNPGLTLPASMFVIKLLKTLRESTTFKSFHYLLNDRVLEISK